MYVNMLKLIAVGRTFQHVLPFTDCTFCPKVVCLTAPCIGGPSVNATFIPLLMNSFRGGGPRMCKDLYIKQAYLTP